MYAECVAATATELKLKPELVACHGQTILHDAAKGVTWQIGEPAAIAERLRLPVGERLSSGGHGR